MALHEPKMRLMKRDDLDAVAAIDALISKQQRRQYYERKIETVINNPHNINTSLVAEVDGKVVGFIMGDVYFGEFGIPETSATIDTIGVHPDCQNHGVAHDLIDQFLTNMKGVGVSKVYTLVNWNDFSLERFFGSHKFQPSKRINLELQLP
ncbi:MAG TPA: GNAT family N-acetyltransferase [Burkholderiaceae bacterium]|nr:GNAT family N-acetyltransferase [Burkholderiaceae bacterium]